MPYTYNTFALYVRIEASEFYPTRIFVLRVLAANFFNFVSAGAPRAARAALWSEP